MGGLGSGHWYRSDSRRTVESCRSIDVRWLVREKLIEPGIWRSGSLKWRDTDTDEVRASIGYIVDAVAGESGTMRLKYTYKPAGAEHEEVDYPVRLVTTRPHMGGLRWWFICPLVVNDRPCRRRVAKLYGSGRYFGCRACKGLAYLSSQEAHQEERIERMLRKMWRIHGGLPDPATASDGELLLLLRAMDR